MMMCDPVLLEPANYCPQECSHALIALTSTEEGQELMNVSIHIVVTIKVHVFLHKLLLLRANIVPTRFQAQPAEFFYKGGFYED